jgi:hypothetical protein
MGEDNTERSWLLTPKVGSTSEKYPLGQWLPFGKLASFYFGMRFLWPRMTQALYLLS